MCRVPTNISPVVVRLPHLRVFENVVNGIRLDVKQAASERGHHMSPYRAGISHCMDCKMEVSVYHLHHFEGGIRGIGYKGTALDSSCPGLMKGKSLVTRVPPNLRPMKSHTEATS